MRVYTEMSLTRFEFWGGAKDRAKMLTYEELEQIGNVLEDIYDKIKDVLINNLFWFNFSQVCESIEIKYNEEEDRIIREEESEE